MIKNRRLFNSIEFSIRLLITLIFLYTGASKILNPAEFAEAIDNYRILPYFVIPTMAIILPWFEIITAISLLTYRFRIGAALAIMGMMAVFTLAIGTAVIRGLDINCGCFVAPGEVNSVGYTRMTFDIVLLIITVFIYRHSLVTFGNTTD